MTPLKFHTLKLDNNECHYNYGEVVAFIMIKSIAITTKHGSWSTVIINRNVSKVMRPQVRSASIIQTLTVMTADDVDVGLSTFPETTSHTKN